jgi:hypothetical protein
MKTLIYLSIMIISSIGFADDSYQELLEKVDNIEREQRVQKLTEQVKASDSRFCKGSIDELNHWKACPDLKGIESPEIKDKMKMLCFKNYTAAWDETKERCGVLTPYNPPDPR